MSKVVLVVAAHTDDEVLGCGGAIANHVARGDKVYCIFIADGVSSRKGAIPKEFDDRSDSARRAHLELGICEAFYLGFPDNSLDTVSLLDIVQKIESIADSIKPQVIYTHHYGDLNVDHQITHRAALTAFRPIPESTVREIYTFEVVSSTDYQLGGDFQFTPNYFLDVTDVWFKKINALKMYDQEMRDPPHSRSYNHVEALAQHRGLSVGLMYAEAFMIVRHIQKND